MEFVIEKVIDAVLESSGLKEKVGRSQRVIRLLQRFGLDAIGSLETFEDIYAHALVQYAFDESGLCKPEPLVQFFKAKEMRELFQGAYYQNEPDVWLRKGEDIAQFKLGKQLSGLDPKRELGIFAATFVELVKQTRSPKEIQQEQKLDGLQKQLQSIQTQIQQLPNLESINQHINQLAGTAFSALPAQAQTSNAVELARQLGEWFEVLDYDRDPDYEIWTADYFEWIINFPLTRRQYFRILVRGTAGEVGMADLQEFKQAIERTGTDQGWLLGNRRVSKATRKAVQQEEKYKNITCYTFDELLDEDAEFSKYLDWLEAEIKAQGVDTDYLPLACRKDELDPNTQQKIGVSIYGEEDGWIDGYVDQWLDDPAKEHLSILGEFGTGKTWFALHYAWVALQHYQDAKKRGIERPRVPIVISLRDYAKSVTVESLFSEFFFRKHEILKSYSAFEQLNRMGKLLLIFDGFDEMAARVNRQAMIDNFWELAKVVVPGAKAILTCRTEHFPDAIEGRRLLNAELKASTANLTGEPPQFEVLELEKFSDSQIALLLSRKAQDAAVKEVLDNPQLLDLARRPVMIDLILEALPDIETGKPVDMARIYLYAITHKMERDIKSERTFTSLADKLYFLCELSWEMLSTDQMSLNYQSFPDCLTRLFPQLLEEERELDHWRYDMMGQTILIRNSEGDYSPAHRSLLEFFVAYKIIASLGIMADDFTALARKQSYMDKALAPRKYTWNEYFKRDFNTDIKAPFIAPLQQFKSCKLNDLMPFLRNTKLAKALLDLAAPMIDKQIMREHLLALIKDTRGKSPQEVGYISSNIIQLMLAKTPRALEGVDLSHIVIQGSNLTQAQLRNTNFESAHLSNTVFTKVIGNITTVTFSPNGRHIAVGDGRGNVQIWDLVTDQVVFIYLGHSNGVRSVAFSPDGSTLASGSDDHTIKLWSAKTGEYLKTLEGHSKWVLSVIFSPNGKMLASASSDKSIKLWSAETGECIKTLEGHVKSNRCVAFKLDSTILASGSYDNTIKLWSTESGECLKTLKGHLGAVTSVSFSPDGSTLASGSHDSTIKLWSEKSDACIKSFDSHSKDVISVAFSSDGKVLASGSHDKTIKLWDIASGKCLTTLDGHSKSVLCVVFSPINDQTLMSCNDHNTIKIWSLDSGECIKTLQGYSNLIDDIAISPDSKILASGSSDQTIKLWSVKTGQCLNILEGHSHWVVSLSFSPDGKSLISSSHDGTVKLWSVASGQCLKTLEGHSKWVLSVVMSPTGEILASSGSDKKIKLWSVDSGKCLKTWEGHTNWVGSLAFSPDGRFLASGSDDNTIKLWLVETGECIKTLKGHSYGIWSLAFSPDGRFLASGSDDNTIKLWLVETGECIKTLKGHSNWVLSVSFSDDGSVIASCSYDQTVKLWSVESGKTLSTLKGHSNWVLSVAFKCADKILASGSYDETIRFWDIKTGECLQVICDRLCEGMNITHTTGLSEGQYTALKLMGAIDYSDSVAVASTNMD